MTHVNESCHAVFPGPSSTTCMSHGTCMNELCHTWMSHITHYFPPFPAPPTWVMAHVWTSLSRVNYMYHGSCEWVMSRSISLSLQHYLHESWHIYVYVYVYIYIHICICICTYIYIYIYMYMYIYEYTYVYIHKCISMYIHIFIYALVSPNLPGCLLLDRGIAWLKQEGGLAFNQMHRLSVLWWYELGVRACFRNRPLKLFVISPPI